MAFIIYHIYIYICDIIPILYICSIIPILSYLLSLAFSLSDLRSQERVDSKLCFGIPDEGEGPTGDFDECSIKDMKIILRKIGVPEEELAKCVEKSDFKKLMELVSQVTTRTYICPYMCV